MFYASGQAGEAGIEQCSRPGGRSGDAGLVERCERAHVLTAGTTERAGTGGEGTLVELGSREASWGV